MIEETICDKGIKCPHCGHVHDATDFEIESDYLGSLECDECEKDFAYCAKFSLMWCTRLEPY